MSRSSLGGLTSCKKLNNRRTNSLTRAITKTPSGTQGPKLDSFMTVQKGIYRNFRADLLAMTMINKVCILQNTETCLLSAKFINLSYCIPKNWYKTMSFIFDKKKRLLFQKNCLMSIVQRTLAPIVLSKYKTKPEQYL